MSKQNVHDPLPVGWTESSLHEVCDVNPPGGETTIDDDELVSFLPMSAVSELTGNIDLSRERKFGEVRKGYARFRNGDVLFAKITPSMENGKVAVASELKNEIGCGSTEFHVVRPCDDIDPYFIWYFLVRGEFRQVAQRNMRGTAGQLRVPPEYLSTSRLPIPPSAEQKRIVSKIDELFSKIDEGEANLKRVEALVKQYRQSVLKAAVTGELTKDWRAQNADKLESGEDLLNRVLEARRAAWEESELAKLREKGKEPTNDKWKEQYKEPAASDVTDLPDLPDGWVWARAEQICDFITKGTTPKSTEMSQHVGDVPFVKVYNLTFSGVLDFSIDPTFIPKVVHQTNLKRSVVYPGDILINIVGPPLGQVSVVPDLFPEWNMNQAVAVFRPLEGINTNFIQHYLMSEATSGWLSQRAKATAGQVNLTLELCRDLPVPLPNVQEQREIADGLEAIMSKINNLAPDVEMLKKTSIALRQSVLKDAFAGDLVPQDPDDEPASVLLERIASEREARKAAERENKEKKKKPGTKVRAKADSTS